MTTVLPPLPLGEGWGEGGPRVAEPSAKYIVQREAPLIRGFELLAMAQGGADSLRKPILSLAAQGRLVRPEPAEESVSLLLDRIREARKTSIPRRSTVAVPTAEQCRFTLPSDWCWVRLDQVANMRLGKMLDKAKNTGTFRPYLRNSNVQWHRFELDDIKDIRLEAHELEEYRLVAGDLLVCEGGEPGRCAIWRSPGREMYFQKALHRVRPLGGVLPEFIQLCLTHDAATGALATYFTGATIKHFAGQELSRYAMPLPPLAEQHRIVARVEELMKLCDALEQSGRLADEQHARLTSTLFDALAASESAHALAENWQRIAEHFDLLLDRPEAIDALEQTILQLAVRGLLVAQIAGDGLASEALGTIAKEKERLIAIGSTKRAKPPVPVVDAEQPFAVPLSWAWVRVADLCSLVTDGEHATPQRCDDTTAIPLVTAKNVRSEVMDYTVTDFVPRDVAAKCWLRCKPEPGDILMVSVGATLGRLCVLREAFDMVLVRSVTLLRPVHAGVYADYLALHLMSSASQREIWGEVKQSAQPGLYLAKSAALKIALPPRAEQHHIVARVEELRRLCAQLRQRLTEASRTQSQLAEALVYSALLGE